MLNSRNFLWLIPLLVLVSFPAWRLPLISFLEPRGGYNPDFGKRDKNVHDFIMEKVVIIQDQLGEKTAEVHAETAYTTDVPDEFELTVVNADLFGKDGEIVKVKAKTGLYNTQTRKLTLKQEVHVFRERENQNLYTELLFYNDHNQTIHSPVNTRLADDNLEIRGSSLDYDITTNQYKIGGRVYCTIHDTSKNKE